MPVITTQRGVVIAWSGIQAGPIQEFEPGGRESPWVRYEAEVGTGDPETARIVVRVQKSWRKLVPQLAFSVESAERQVVERLIEERVNGNLQPLATGAANNFTIFEDQMLQRYQQQ